MQERQVSTTKYLFIYFKNTWCLLVTRRGVHIYRRKTILLSTQNSKQRTQNSDDMDFRTAQTLVKNIFILPKTEHIDTLGCAEFGPFAIRPHLLANVWLKIPNTLRPKILWHFKNWHFMALMSITGFPLFSSHKFPWLFQYFFHFSLTFIKYFYGFYSILLYALKYSLQYPEVRIFTLLHPKYSHEPQIIRHLTHFGPAPGMKWFIHYPKKGILE